MQGGMVGSPADGNVAGVGVGVGAGGGGGGGGGGFEGASVIVGDLHWWSSDADVEAMASTVGKVTGIKFFEEKATGRSKGYCVVSGGCYSSRGGVEKGEGRAPLVE